MHQSLLRPASWIASPRVALAVLLAGLLSACETERKIYVLTDTGRILGFDSAAPDRIDSEVEVSGLADDEQLLQIDYRPANGLFYCLTTEERLCTVDPDSGRVNLVRELAFSEDSLSGPVIDFNPVADRLRVIASEQNLRVNPADGSLAATDTVVAFDEDDANAEREPRLVAIAYDNNRSDAGSTTLYGLDLTTRSLVRVGSEGGSPESPNGGLLFTVASLGADFTANSGFDVEPDGDTAYAALTPGGTGARLYRINLENGSADLVGTIGDGDASVISLAVRPEERSDGSPGS